MWTLTPGVVHKLFWTSSRRAKNWHKQSLADNEDPGQFPYVRAL